MKILIVSDDHRMVTPNMGVLVSDKQLNNSVTNMVNYIYDNCESYLYEERNSSMISSSTKENSDSSLQQKINTLHSIIKTYKLAYEHIKNNPYTKLLKSEKYDSFEKITTITPKTINYIVSHTDELYAVNYDTGIRHGKTYFQPYKTIIEYNNISYDTYENQIIVGFLIYITNQIDLIIKEIKNCISKKDSVNTKNGYIDSLYEISKVCIKKLKKYIYDFKIIKEQFQQEYFIYSTFLGIKGSLIHGMPQFTPVFKSILAYRIIYSEIHKWFNGIAYDLSKDELILNFISTSKIYEYYCLIKILKNFENSEDINLIRSNRLQYNANYYSNTKHNNFFLFRNESIKISLFFQPVIYNNTLAINNIRLFRNTSTCSTSDRESPGGHYTPDYLLKIEYEDHTDYIILDAKFSYSDYIKRNKLQELVYKYIFSISPLDDSDRLLGIILLCGKDRCSDKRNAIHDYADKNKIGVIPFADILIMNGNNPLDDTMIKYLSEKYIKKVAAPEGTAVNNQI
ncbi:MAG: DUF2357 domain-containing protein [Ruminococcus flavefaciens]